MKTEPNQAERNEEVSPASNTQEFHQQKDLVRNGEIGELDQQKDSILSSEALNTPTEINPSLVISPNVLGSESLERISKADVDRMKQSPTDDTTKGDVPWDKNNSPAELPTNQ